MTKKNAVNKMMAIVIAVVMIACALGLAVSQTSFAADHAEGLAAHEQVMDDNAQADTDAIALEAHEQVNG